MLIRSLPLLLLVGLCLVLGVGDAWAVEEVYSFPFLGPPPTSDYILRGIIFGWEFFQQVGGRKEGSTALFYLALTAAVIGFLQLVFIAKNQNLVTALAWGFLVITLLLTPTGSGLIYTQVKTYAPANSSIPQAAVYGFTPQLIVVHIGGMLQNVAGALFDTAGVKNMVANVMAESKMRESDAFKDLGVSGQILQHASENNCQLGIFPPGTTAPPRFDQATGALIPAETENGAGSAGGGLIKFDGFLQQYIQPYVNSLATANANPATFQANPAAVGTPPIGVITDDQAVVGKMGLDTNTPTTEGMDYAQAIFAYRDALANQTPLNRNPPLLEHLSDALCDIQSLHTAQLENGGGGRGYATPSESSFYVEVRSNKCPEDSSSSPAALTRLGLRDPGERLFQKQIGEEFLTASKYTNFLNNNQADASTSVPVRTAMNDLIVYPESMPLVTYNNDSIIDAESLKQQRRPAGVQTCYDKATNLTRSIISEIHTNLDINNTAFGRAMINQDLQALRGMVGTPAGGTGFELQSGLGSGDGDNKARMLFNAYLAQAYSTISEPAKSNAEAVVQLAYYQYMAFMTHQAVQATHEAAETQGGSGTAATAITNSGSTATLRPTAVSPLGGILGSIASRVGFYAVEGLSKLIGTIATIYVEFLWVFIQMALLAIFLITPVFLVLGLLIPANAPGILATSVLSVAVLCAVPSVFMLIDFIVTILYYVFNKESIEQGWLMGILSFLGDAVALIPSLFFDSAQALTAGEALRNTYPNIDSAILLLAASGLYTGTVGITMFLMFKAGDTQSVLSNLSQLDSKANEAANVANKIGLAAMAAMALPVAGVAMRAALGTSAAAAQAGAQTAAALGLQGEDAADFAQRSGRYGGLGGLSPARIIEGMYQDKLKDAKTDEEKNELAAWRDETLSKVDNLSGISALSDFSTAYTAQILRGGAQGTQVGLGYLSASLPGGGGKLFQELGNINSEGRAEGEQAAQRVFDGKSSTAFFAATAGLWSDDYKSNLAQQRKKRAQIAAGAIEADKATYEQQLLAAEDGAQSSLQGLYSSSNAVLEGRKMLAAERVLATLDEEDKQRILADGEITGAVQARMDAQKAMIEAEIQLAGQDPNAQGEVVLAKLQKTHPKMQIASLSAVTAEQAEAILGEDMPDVADLNDPDKQASIEAALRKKFATPENIKAHVEEKFRVAAQADVLQDVVLQDVANVMNGGRARFTQVQDAMARSAGYQPTAKAASVRSAIGRRAARDYGRVTRTAGTVDSAVEKAGDVLARRAVDRIYSTDVMDAAQVEGTALTGGKKQTRAWRMRQIMWDKEDPSSTEQLATARASREARVVMRGTQRIANKAFQKSAQIVQERGVNAVVTYEDVLYRAVSSAERDPTPTAIRAAEQEMRFDRQIGDITGRSSAQLEVQSKASKRVAVTTAESRKSMEIVQQGRQVTFTAEVHAPLKRIQKKIIKWLKGAGYSNDDAIKQGVDFVVKFVEDVNDAAQLDRFFSLEAVTEPGKAGLKSGLTEDGAKALLEFAQRKEPRIAAAIQGDGKIQADKSLELERHEISGVEDKPPAGTRGGARMKRGTGSPQQARPTPQRPIKPKKKS